LTRDDVTEAKLIRRFRAGDGEALCALFDRHEGLLRDRAARHLPARLRRRHSISDVLQESRIVAFRRGGDFEPRDEHSLRNWLLEIVERKARRAVQRHDAVAKRSISREVTRTQRPETAKFEGAVPSPSQVAMAAELAEQAKMAMSRLPEDYREVLRLSRKEDLNLKEIAVHMGRSYEATKKLYGRALARLGTVLREMRGETGG